MIHDTRYTLGDADVNVNVNGGGGGGGDGYIDNIIGGSVRMCVW